MIHRKINLNTIWQRAKIRPTLLLFAFQGISFSLLLFLPMAVMMNSFKDVLPYVENTEEIKSNGIKENAIITGIHSIENITVNGKNPTVLTYEFNLNGKKTHSKFSVFDPTIKENIKKGDIIPIKYLNGSSIVLGYEQYTFRMDFMYYLAGGSFLIGLIFCYLLYSRIKKEIELYKTGRIKEAKIVSISHNKGFTFSKFGMSMDVHYEYEHQNRKKIIDKSRTNNFALTNHKSFGDTIRILVSQDGNSSCLYPELIAKSNNWKDNYVA